MSSLEPLKRLSLSDTQSAPALGPHSGIAEKLVIKTGNLFYVADSRGELAPSGARDLGLFFDDTRYLSHYRTSFPGFSLELLSSAVTIDGLIQVDLTAAPIVREEVGLESQRFLHIRRIQV